MLWFGRPGITRCATGGGGFCFFNNTAFVCRALALRARVAMLDIDVHHGNGTQALFYRSSRALTVSIHGSPTYTYPFYSGYEEEQGVGMGRGYNVNLPLPKETGLPEYRQALGPSADAFPPVLPVRQTLLDAG